MGWAATSLLKSTGATMNVTHQFIMAVNYTDTPAIVHPVQKHSNQQSPLVISLYK